MEPEKIDQYLKKRIIGEASESKCPEELLDKQSLTTAFEELVGTRGQEETKYYAKQWKEKRKHDKTLTWSDYIYLFFARPFCIKLQKLFVGRCSCIL